VRTCFKMMVVYLDWNIYAHFRDWKFKGEESYSKYKILEDLKNSGQIQTYYSDAHILDLMPENVDSRYLSKDLETISLLTDNICSVSAHIGEIKSKFNPEVMYNNVRKNFSMVHTLETINQSCEYIRNLLQPYLVTLAEQGLEKQASETSDDKSNMILEQMFEEHNEMLNNPKYFREQRSEQLKKLKNNPMIKKKLSGSDEDKLKVFFALIPFFLKEMPSCTQNKNDLCLYIFLILDQLNLWTDKVYKNLMIDALHAVYASHSDTKILITNDNNFRNKAIVTYQVLGIDLRVVCFDEFETDIIDTHEPQS